MSDAERERRGRILTSGGWRDGSVVFDDRILRLDLVTQGNASPEHWIVPGFIDLHVPGGGGGDVMDGAAGVRVLARLHARHGTTALTPSPVTAPADDLAAAAAGIAEVQAAPGPNEARILGAHIEGPFINPARAGAQPPFAAPPDAGLVDRLLAIVAVKIVTLAPELPGALPLIRTLRARGVAVQLGHSAASYAETVAALDAGATGFTHLFNAMTPLHHRAPGMVGAALAHADYAALIPDLLHVEAGAIRTALRAIPNLYFVTDAVAAAGMPDGDYSLGRQTVRKQGDGVYLAADEAQSVLAGSALTMDRALRNLLGIGLSLDAAVRRISTIPADYLGLADCGRIAVGARADLVVLDAQADVVEVLIGGIAVDRG